MARGPRCYGLTSKISSYSMTRWLMQCPLMRILPTRRLQMDYPPTQRLSIGAYMIGDYVIGKQEVTEDEIARR